MAIPLVYNIRSVRRRWASSLVAVLGIAGTVAVFVAMLALARGFKATIVSSGLPQNAIVHRLRRFGRPVKTQWCLGHCKGVAQRRRQRAGGTPITARN